MQLNALNAQPCGFAIITLPRSGSYHLTSLLDSARDIVCHGEIFKPDFVELRPFYLKKLQLSEHDIQARDRDRIKFVSNLRLINPHKIFGFKAFPDHLAHDQSTFDFILKNPKWKKIFLFRNPIESYGSLLRANNTGIWVMEENSAANRDQLQAKVEFHADSFLEHLKLCNWFEQISSEADSIKDNKCYRINYNEIPSKENLQKVLSFLESSSLAVDLHSKHYRQFSLPTQEGFSNWEALEKFLKANSLTHLVSELRTDSETHRSY